MIRWHLFLAGWLAGVGLAGCQLQERLSPAGPCVQGECRVAVSVGPDCHLAVDPEHLHVPSGGEAHVLWRIDPPSAPFVFDANGISFPPGQNPNQLFDQKEPREQGKVFHWRDKNDRRGDFKYVVNVRDAAGRLCQLDPFIHNQ